MKKFKNSLLTSLLLVTLSSATYVKAEDAEVFFSVNLAKPNLLFVLDNSGSMEWDVQGNTRLKWEQYYSYYYGWRWRQVSNPDFSGASRMTILKNAVQAVLADEEISNVNIGLMRYGPGYNNNTFTTGSDYYGEASTSNPNHRSNGIQGVTFPVTDINEFVTEVIPSSSDEYFLPSLADGVAGETVRSYLSRIIDDWQPSGGTPIVGSLYEAALYYRGEKMHYGQDNPNHMINDNKQSAPIAAHPSTYLNETQTSVIPTNYLTGPTASDSPVNARNHAIAPRYNSPIKSHCQSNYIVMMSDGRPTYYNSSLDAWDKELSPLAKDMQGNSGYSDLAEALPECATDTGFTSASGKCGPELTKFLAENDNSSIYDEDQFIKTFTIGFGSNMPAVTRDYLKSLATFDDPDTEEGADEDAFFSAESPAELVASFRKILRRIGKPKDSLASPGYSVNVRSGLEHEDEIYIPLFSRKETALWSGNLKKFKLVDVDGKRLIRGKNNKNATDDDGRFTEVALDYWSDLPSSTNEPDGKIVEEGGVAEKIHPQGRKVYSNISNSDNLSAPSNEITADNFASLPVSLFGLEGQGHHGHDHYSEQDRQYKRKLANFIRGWKDGEYDSNANPKGLARRHMGDMLHSVPLVVTYPDGGGQYIFAGTNEGYLHAFDTSTGEEKFAFMPKELIKNIKVQFQNAGTQRDHKYGVDGNISYWFDKKNGRHYLYFGMRRGGSSYYALDITDINQPKLKWVKSNESGNKYLGMGQSWSAPYLAKIGTSSGAKEVVIISGGYDGFGSKKGDDRNKGDGSLEVDDATSNRRADVGNDILILDAKTGEHIFSLNGSQRSEIKGSIPGGVRMLDTNFNNLVDRLYFADTAGSIWRLDLSETLSGTGSESSLTEMANFSNNSQKFYNEPDVAVMKLNGKTVFAISIGSGFRAHPLDKSITDNFYVVLDKSPFDSLNSSYEPVRDVSGAEKELAELTVSPNEVVSFDYNDGEKITISDAGKWGWKINLPFEGEKVLATSTTRDGVVKFTTLIPEVLEEGQGVDLCAAPPTQAVLYAFNILTGLAGYDLNGDGSVSSGDQGEPTLDISTRIPPGTIPGKPEDIFNSLEVTDKLGDDGEPTGEKECKHPVDIRIGKRLSQITGYDACRLEALYWSDPSTSK